MNFLVELAEKCKFQNGFPVWYPYIYNPAIDNSLGLTFNRLTLCIMTNISLTFCLLTIKSLTSFRVTSPTTTSMRSRSYMPTYTFAELFNEIFFVCKASWSSSFFSFFPHFSFFVNYYLVVEI